MCSFEKIVITTTRFDALKDIYNSHLKEITNKEFLVCFSDESKINLFGNTNSALYIILDNIIILPSIDEIPKNGFDASVFTKMISLSADTSKVLFIFHKSDLGFGQDFMERLLKSNDLSKGTYYFDNKFCKEYKNNVIVFQHNDANSPNIYKDILLNRLLKKELDFNQLFTDIIEKYKLLEKPWAKLVSYRNNLILGLSPDSKDYKKCDLTKEFELRSSEKDKDEQIKEIEKIIVTSSIQQFSYDY